jgi:hypothetical protein
MALTAIHPGEHLAEELTEFGMSAHRSGTCMDWNQEGASRGFVRTHLGLPKEASEDGAPAALGVR